MILYYILLQGKKPWPDFNYLNSKLFEWSEIWNYSVNVIKIPKHCICKLGGKIIILSVLLL